jgi:hypothetical protein
MSAGAHVYTFEQGANIGTATATYRASETRLDIRQPDVVVPAIGAGLDVMTAAVVSAIDQHLGYAGLAFRRR